MAWLLIPLVLVVLVYLAGFPRTAAALLATAVVAGVLLYYYNQRLDEDAALAHPALRRHRRERDDYTDVPRQLQPERQRQKQFGGVSAPGHQLQSHVTRLPGRERRSA